MQATTRRQVGTALFLVGLVIGLALALSAIWADFEGMSYFATGADYDQFGGLHCPVLMSRSERAAVSAEFDNNSDKEIQPYYQVEISGLPSSRNLEDHLTVPPRSSRTLTWTVDSHDIDLGFFIFNKIDILPFAGHATREATCGIMVLNVGGLSGAALMAGALATSLLGIVLGLAIREGVEETAAARDVSARDGLRATGVAALLGLLAALTGLWLIGLLLCAIALLLLVIMLRFAVS